MGLRTTDITDMPIYSIDIDIIDYCRDHRLRLHDGNNSRVGWSTATRRHTQRKAEKQKKRKRNNKRQQERARNKTRVCLPFPIEFGNNTLSVVRINRETTTDRMTSQKSRNKETETIFFG